MGFEWGLNVTFIVYAARHSGGFLIQKGSKVMIANPSLLITLQAEFVCCCQGRGFIHASVSAPIAEHPLLVPPHSELLRMPNPGFRRRGGTLFEVVCHE